VRCAYAPGVRGLALLRRDLDAALLRAAVGAGVRFEDGVIVRGPMVDEGDGAPRVCGAVFAGRDGRDVRVPAPLVIAADGRRSRLALSLGLTAHPRRPRRWAIGAYFEGVAGVTSFGEMHVRRGRYIGVARVSPSLTNVCLVVPDHRSPGEGDPDRRLADPAALLRSQLSRDRLLADRFVAARMVTPPAVLGPLAVDARAAGMRGLLLAGDAAGFIDPMTGDGLRFAVRGGELAAEAAMAALNGRVAAPHAALAHARRREFRAKCRFNRAVRRLVSRGLAIEAAGLLASAAPWVLRRAVAFAGDVS